MSEMIRIDNRLLTIRMRLEVGRSATVVVLTGFRGQEQLAEASAPAEAFGMVAKLNANGYRTARFELPRAVGEPITAFVQRERAQHEPLWLQIDRSSGLLAVVPWEQLLAPLVHAPMLRIPNFLVEPTPPSAGAVFAVCASSPAAKTPYPVHEQVASVVAAMVRAAPAAPVHVFADQQAVFMCRDVCGQVSPNAIVHDPLEAAAFGRGRTGRIATGSSSASPWLLWIRSALGAARLAGVHFACPGYFTGGRGALALAESPTANDDAAWSHFIGAQELESFLRLTGAWSFAASTPYESVWTVGLRLLVEELCWMRPGPLLLDETGPAKTEVVADAYSFLLGNIPSPPDSDRLSLRCHPRRMRAYAEAGEQLVTSQDPARPLASEASAAVQSRISSFVSSTLGAGLEQSWQISALQGLEEEAADLAGCSEHELRGRSAALRFLSDLVGGARPDALPGSSGIADYIESDRGGVR